MDDISKLFISGCLVTAIGDILRKNGRGLTSLYRQTNLRKWIKDENKTRENVDERNFQLKKIVTELNAGQ